MATTETRIDGLAELHKLLQGLPAKVEGNVMRGALRAGQKVVQEAVQSRVPVDSGALRNSIKIRFRSRSQKYGWVRMHLTAGDKVAWYAHLLEYGTASFYTGSGKSVRKPYVISATDKNGKRFGSLERRRINRGSEAAALFWQGQMAAKVVHPGVRPMSFMRSGFDAAQQPALDAVAAYIRTRLPKELKKAGR